MEKVIENTLTAVFGAASIAFLTLTDLKDWVAVAVGIVTIVCLIYNTFFKSERRKK